MIICVTNIQYMNAFKFAVKKIDISLFSRSTTEQMLINVSRILRHQTPLCFLRSIFEQRVVFLKLLKVFLNLLYHKVILSTKLPNSVSFTLSKEYIQRSFSDWNLHENLLIRIFALLY